MNKFADLHIHPTLKSFVYHNNNNKKKGNIWFQDKPRKRERDNFFIKYTQSDFTTLAQAGVKIAFISLYPLEQGWVNSNGTSFITNFLVYIFTKFPIRQINRIQLKNHNYFKELKSEIKFLKNEIEEAKVVEIDGKKETIYAKIPKNKIELSRFLNEKNTLIIIPTIEGTNSLYSGNASSVNENNLDDLLKNIDILKNEIPPLFITFAHHFTNGLCGHAKSLYGDDGLTAKIIKKFLNQAEGLEDKINDKGRLVINKLLAINSFEGEKRTLIDIKHMNEKSRKEFYNIIKNHNYIHPEDKIPIIASHVGYSGQPTLNAVSNICKANSEFPFKNTCGQFNEARINLTDEDVLNIFESEGIIGINLDQRIISNKKIIEEAKDKFNYKDTPELKLFWAKQIGDNIIEMARTIIDNKVENYKNVWNLFAIGSDFDGFINPVDGYITTIEYAELKKHLILVFNDNKYVKNNSFGRKVEEIVNNIMFKNAQEFTIKHI
ncbi:MAG: hypothetical protein U9Q83_01540 [Bacteroidota bacterium]|nr:hypothetical protein [Bacteroidota bacterium]